MCDEFISNARSFFVRPMFRCLLQYNIWITIGNSGIVHVWVHWLGNMELPGRVYVFCKGEIVSHARKMCSCCNCWYVPMSMQDVLSQFVALSSCETIVCVRRTNKYLWATCNGRFMLNYKSSGFKRNVSKAKRVYVWWRRQRCQTSPLL